MVAVLDEDNALYFICLTLVLEMHFHTLTFQVGGKHVPVTTPTDLLFENVVKLVLGLVRLFQSVALDTVFSIRHVQAVF